MSQVCDSKDRLGVRPDGGLPSLTTRMHARTRAVHFWSNPVAVLSRMVGPVEHLKLDSVGVLEGQHGNVLAHGDGRVRHAQLSKTNHPVVQVRSLIDLGTKVIKTRAGWIEGLAAVRAVLLDFDDRPRGIV